MSLFPQTIAVTGCISKNHLAILKCVYRKWPKSIIVATGPNIRHNEEFVDYSKRRPNIRLHDISNPSGMHLKFLKIDSEPLFENLGLNLLLNLSYSEKYSENDPNSLQLRFAKFYKSYAHINLFLPALIRSSNIRDPSRLSCSNSIILNLWDITSNQLLGDYLSYLPKIKLDSNIIGTGCKHLNIILATLIKPPNLEYSENTTLPFLHKLDTLTAKHSEGFYDWNMEKIYEDPPR